MLRPNRTAQIDIVYGDGSVTVCASVSATMSMNIQILFSFDYFWLLPRFVHITYYTILELNDYKRRL